MHVWLIFYSRWFYLCKFSLASARTGIAWYNAM